MIASPRRWRLSHQALRALYAYYLTDSDEAVDLAKGYALLEKLCLAGQGGACNSVADHATARSDIVKWRRKSCGAKEGGDCGKLDQLLYRDEDPGLTPAHATSELETRCNGGDTEACSLAAARHFDGKGAKASRADSDIWVVKVCELGAGHECYVLGRRAQYDQNDKKAAQAWFQKACTAKDADGCSELEHSRR